MFETSQETPITPEQQEGPQARVFFIRHSKASYKNYTEKVASLEPETPLDIETQSADLPPGGVELAREAAKKFFSQFNPTRDVLFIVSSSQMRALETAKIYADVAREMGIEVVEHEKTGTNVAKEVGQGLVRSVNTLSLTMPNQVFGQLFNPPAHIAEINWDAVSSDTKEKFEKAREIVLTDDKGSWGANFYAHAAEIKKIIPEMETPEQLYETQFKNMQRLAQFARTKLPEEKRLNVIGFGHENYMGKALEEYTGGHSMGNVEAVELLEDGILKRV